MTMEVSPQVGLAKVGDRLAVLLHLNTSGPSETMRVEVAGREAWRGGAREAGSITLLMQETATRPRVLPVTVSWGGQSRAYTLYLPNLSRLGQLQGGTAIRRYQDKPLGWVLSDVSWRAGVVILAEGQLDQKVTADLTLESPAAAVGTLAKFAGCDLRTDDYVSFTLSQRRE